MRFELVEDPEEFASRTWPFITERLSRNVLATLLVDVRAGRYDDVERRLALGTGDDGDVAWVGIRTPPHFLLTSDLDPAAAGADRCMLFTDLANPTSNKIYAEVGFRRTGAWEMRAFEAP